MKFARQNYTGLQSRFNNFFSVCQSVSHSIATHIFEYFVRPHVCLSVSPSTHIKHITCVDGAFFSKLGFGCEGRGFGSGGWGWFYFEFLGDYFLLRGFKNFFFSVFCWKFINICFNIHSFIFVYLGEV